MDIPRISVESLLNGGREPATAPPVPSTATQKPGFIQEGLAPYDQNLKTAVQGVRNLITVLSGKPLGKTEMAVVSQERALRTLKRPDFSAPAIAQVKELGGAER